MDLQAGQPAKGGGTGARETMKQRAPLRKKLQKITNKILEESITPFVRTRFPEVCGRVSEGRGCTPCFSLVRKYVIPTSPILTPARILGVPQFIPTPSLHSALRPLVCLVWLILYQHHPYTQPCDRSYAWCG